MARNDLQEFSEFIDATSEKLVDNLDKLMRETALTIGTTVSSATPVDTGLARVSWTAEVDEEDRSFIGKPVGASGQGQTNGGRAAGIAIQRIKENISDFDILKNKEINISNNVNYIDDLNAGKSPQAEANFIESAIQTAVNEVKRARLL